jgi:Zn-dependent protease
MRQGSIRLFSFAGINVFLHWSWFLLAFYDVNQFSAYYGNIFWPVLLFLSLFLIVLMHEFGHALACRQVGGEAHRIILWPLGGIAFVSPPQRPGATLWSIAAGPLVNVALAPVLAVLWFGALSMDLKGTSPDAYRFLRDLCMINLFVLIFNLLPIYPLDGGQILRSLLWFVLGRARSLMVTAAIGFVGVAGLIALAVFTRSPLMGVMAVFILFNCWGGLMQARLLGKLAKLPRRDGFACPSCHEKPVLGPYWRCDKCLKPFDTFATQAVCPNCGTQFGVTRCLDCGSIRPMSEWMGYTPSAPPPLPPQAQPS